MPMIDGPAQQAKFDEARQSAAQFRDQTAELRGRMEVLKVHSQLMQTLKVMAQK